MKITVAVTVHVCTTHTCTCVIMLLNKCRVICVGSAKKREKMKSFNNNFIQDNSLSISYRHYRKHFEPSKNGFGRLKNEWDPLKWKTLKGKIGCTTV